MSGAGARKVDVTGRTTGKTKRHKPLVNLPSNQWLSIPREMLESPAFAALSAPALRVLMRLCIEHLEHGGAENGKLKVTHSQFVAFGIGHNSVKPALIENEALGFIEMMQQGGRSFGDTRLPSQFRLTFPNSRNAPQTHEWFAIKSLDEAKDRIARKKAEWDAARPKRPNRRPAYKSGSIAGRAEAARQRNSGAA
ncbi:hypothetical protein [Consotaella salsifontis]|uniref:Uncharacterized protein n=1 Tax=Consotaella salsifontis TaxID=1365950 RepID=A0A1T4R588_9HYPH|nr:hypothetical protein [Consotaella salsifontis]SKA11047.1 hypothetical protein SAMN05428963_10629 [Consotaella salsifontis]